MDEKIRSMMEHIEYNSQISMEEILQVANTLQNASLQDEGTIRSVVRNLSHLAGTSITPETEDRIVRSIMDHDAPTTAEHLQRYFSNF